MNIITIIKNLNKLMNYKCKKYYKVLVNHINYLYKNMIIIIDYKNH